MGEAAVDLHGVDPIVVALAIALAAKRPLHTLGDPGGGPAGSVGGSAAASLGPTPAKPRSRAPRPNRKG